MFNLYGSIDTFFILIFINICLSITSDRSYYIAVYLEDRKIRDHLVCMDRKNRDRARFQARDFYSAQDIS